MNRPANPYVGLRPFREEEAEVFFGREQQVADLQEILVREQFATVIGTSGCGKSSVLEAGLFPKLRRESSDRPWRIARLQPGGTPVRALARSLAGCEALPQLSALATQEEQVNFVETTLRQSSYGVLTLLEGAAIYAGVDAGRLLIVADQFEELFRFRDGGTDAPPDGLPAGATPAEFVQLLLSSVEDDTFGVRVIIAMRTEFLSDCVRFPGLTERINRSNYLVPRLERDERAAAISRPAEKRGVRMRAALVHGLADQFADEPDQLPILQHTLHRAWSELTPDQHGNCELTEENINAVGGLEDALNRHLGEVLQGAQQGGIPRRHVGRIFQALTFTTNEGNGVRRPLPFDRLCEVAGLTATEGATVVNRFRAEGAGFLLPSTRDELALTAGAKIDICHESLMRRWQLLKTWAEEEDAEVEEWRGLQKQAAEWDGKSSPLGIANLKKAEQFLTSDRLTPAWVRLVARTSKPEEKLAAVQKMVRFERERVRSRNALLALGGLGVLTVMLYAGWLQYEGLRTRRNEAESRAAAKFEAETRQKNDAERNARTLERLMWLVNADRDAEADLTGASAELSQQQARLLNSGEAGYLEVVGDLIGKIDLRLVSLRWARSQMKAGKEEAQPAGSESLLGERWNMEMARRKELRPKIDAMIASFDSLLKTLGMVASSEPPEERLAVYELIATTANAATEGVKQASDTLRWQRPAEQDGYVKTLKNHTAVVRAVAFSNDGRWILTAGNDGRAVLWDGAGMPKREFSSFGGVPDAHLTVAFSRDSNRLAICSRAARVIVSKPGEEEESDILLDGAAGATVRVEATSIAFSPDAKLVAIGCGDAHARLWSLEPALDPRMRPLEDRAVQTDVVRDLKFAPVKIGANNAATLVLTASDDDWAQLWQRTDGTWTPLWRPQKPQTPGTGYSLHNPIRSASFSPDARLVVLSGGTNVAVVGSEDGVERWNDKAPWDGSGAIRERLVERSSFNASGKLVSVAGRSQKVDVRAADSGASLGVLDHHTPVTALAWSPTSPDLILTGCIDGTVFLWNVKSDERPLVPQRQAKHHTGAVTSLSWSGDGGRFVSGSDDNTAVLWAAPH